MGKLKDYTKVAIEGTRPLLDFMGKEIHIGDVVLASHPKNKGYVEYSTLVVMGRTPRQIKVRKIPGRYQGKQDIIHCIEEGSRLFKETQRSNGAAISPCQVFKLYSKVVTQDEIQDAITKGLAANQTTTPTFP